MKHNKYESYYNEPVNSIVELIERSEKLYGSSVAVRYKKKRKPQEKTYKDLCDDSKNLGRWLLDQSLANGHIGILGASSYEWIISYIGAVFAGMVAVPLDKELNATDISDLLKRADVDLLFYDSNYVDIINQIKDESELSNLKMISFDSILTLNGSNIGLPKVVSDKMSSILFTSGTTGKSKGVMLTQRNIASNVIQGLGAVDLHHEKDIILSVLPMNHAYEFTCTVLGMIYKGVTICICSGLKYIQKEFVEYKPTVMFVVPLLAENFYERIEASVKQQKKETVFKIGKKASAFLRKFNIDLTNLLFADIKSAFGGELKTLMCGGAPLNEELIKKYADIGINLFQGYGLTECSPLLTVNFDYYHRPNSVGKIVVGNSAKVVDGEIWASGLSVSNGYYKDKEATSSAFENGWFKTGDLGNIDADGFIFITGRKKNLIILSNGKNVSPEEIESVIENNIPQVKEVLVYAENDRIVAEIYSEDLNEYAKSNIEKDIENLNLKLPSFKQIAKVKFRKNEFPKTTTKKIKRNYEVQHNDIKN